MQSGSLARVFAYIENCLICACSMVTFRGHGGYACIKWLLAQGDCKILILVKKSR